ncbi:CRAL-TRIO domain-containing protein [Aspergillus pseudonomiae]|uniref:CRAL-TRIO domain-containing protein n=1 Tax=Aspergillus pseudonomiae TaxID=1506151 RepID=A0A5N6HYS7_9EURO|nr:CRAL-TRIO domain-containing protein [Aspergillus pseudonomiae]KAB8257913.1 CRAL-TRIO domain-containing protein [Aspergillus pseudonomiae]KAE8408098.1 CRAL-TRIO domain-containing protein [Aspergillus pseudonomiae]
MSATSEPTAPAMSAHSGEAVDSQTSAPSATAESSSSTVEQAQPATNGKDIESELPSSAADGLIQKPFPHPLDSAKPTPPAELTADQHEKYNSVLRAVSAWTTVPTTSAKNAPTEPITDNERMFLTRECLLRYLRATKWNVSEAIARLERTLTWRREYGVEKLTADFISVENETGKQVLLGYDIHARPCLYLLPSNQNTEKSDRQIQHLVFMLERVIDLMPPDQETLALIVNYNETKSGQNASVGQAKQTLNFLQNHYPERMGRALVINMPFMIMGFFKLITPFIDPLTRQKLKFNEDLCQHVPAAHLMKSMGGDVEFRYDHAAYWPTLNQLADHRRAAYRERWVQGGKRIGEYENYLKTGSTPSLAQREASNGAPAE